jgi:hypothetical protein
MTFASLSFIFGCFQANVFALRVLRFILKAKVVLSIFAILVGVILDSFIVQPNILFSYLKQVLRIDWIIVCVLLVLPSFLVLASDLVWWLIKAVAVLDLAMTVPAEAVLTMVAPI